MSTKRAAICKARRVCILIAPGTLKTLRWRWRMGEAEGELKGDGKRRKKEEEHARRRRTRRLARRALTMGHGSCQEVVAPHSHNNRFLFPPTSFSFFGRAIVCCAVTVGSVHPLTLLRRSSNAPRSGWNKWEDKNRPKEVRLVDARASSSRKTIESNDVDFCVCKMQISFLLCKDFLELGILMCFFC